MGIPTPTLSLTTQRSTTSPLNSTITINDKITSAKVAVRSMKNRLLSKLKFRMSKSKQHQEQLDCDVSVAESHHSQEADDNALNEALEARLMELIASAPAQDTPITLQFGVASSSASSASTTPSSPISIDGYGWPVFNFASFPQYQTRC